jgi:subtilisin family serine protease
LVNGVKGGIDLINFTEGIPMDDNGHGTHVAGTLGGRDLGIAPGTHLYAVKVLNGNAEGDVSTLIMAFQWAIDNDMDAISMSIAYREDNPAVRLAVQKAYEAGILMVAAVGNHSNWLDDGATGDGGAGDGGAATDGTTPNPYPVMYPAAYPEVFAVGAHDTYGVISEFSNEGPQMDLLAPGSNIVSLNLNGTFGVYSGSSMAAPHVTGTAALVLALDPSLTPDEVMNIVANTAQGGLINVPGAVETVFSSLNPWFGNW